MKKVMAAALLALSFTTGFTCSKNTPATDASAPVEEATPATEATPMDAATPAEGAAPATDATPAQ